MKMESQLSTQTEKQSMNELEERFAELEMERKQMEARRKNESQHRSLLEKQQLKPFRDYAPSEGIDNEDETPLGSQILKVSIGLDQMLTRGFSYENALAKMREQAGEYNPEILNIL